MALGLGLILGGALGNLWDRVALGYVVDFISVHYDNRYFPAFNLADVAITSAVDMPASWPVPVVADRVSAPKWS